MLKFTETKNDQGKTTGIQIPFDGKPLLNTPPLNKGSAFTAEERARLHLRGKLPMRVESMEEQVTRHYAQYLEQGSDLGKNVYLNNIHDLNSTLFYRLVSEHLDEMLPIVYTPTVGEAVQQYSLELRRPHGTYISYPDKDHIEEIFDNRLNDDIQLVLVTDGEGVLGIGDQGVGAMDIAIAKLMVYTLCAGINPNNVLPIQLDVGTNNQKMLDDPMYLGWRHERVRGQDYDDFIAEFVRVLKKKFPNVYLHWEDFGRENARKNLNTYRTEICSFNDDMQGTGAVALACVLSGLNVTDQKLEDQRIVFLGAGTAGCGIADQIKDVMVAGGMSEAEACAKFWLVDRYGLLTNTMEDLPFFQKPYVREQTEVDAWGVKEECMLAQVVEHVKPTILIGCSTVTGAFSESIIKTMAKHVKDPIIMPLSNPTSLAEAKPADLLDWTEGRALIATGSPFEPVEYEGKTRVIAQSNNAYIFPGLGLAVRAAQATQVTDGMLRAACDCLSDMSPARIDRNASLLPSLEDIKKVSHDIAIAVANQAVKEGVAKCDAGTDLEKTLAQLQWEPKYHPYEVKS
jgi:malate dehydrogenase (oxaloacetate-decarboxylating)